MGSEWSRFLSDWLRPTDKALAAQRARGKMSKKKERYIGPIRWRGKINAKDITERVIAGIISGLAAGFAFYLAVRLLGE